VAISSYLSDAAGGVVVAASFPTEAEARVGLELLRASGVRWQDISIVARDRATAERVAGDQAWTPYRNDGLLARLRPEASIPPDLRRRFADALRGGSIVIAAAADGQPPDTLAALFGQAKASRTDQWWQRPAKLFAPPELAGPF
jgi:heat induced stress protein YflT